MGSDITRMWINQPSTLQPYHYLDGQRVLAVHEYDATYRVYFLTGDIVSQQIDGSALSPGWAVVDSLTPEQIQRIAAMMRSARGGVTGGYSSVTVDQQREREKGVDIASRTISWALTDDLRAADIGQQQFQLACGIPKGATSLD
jgi:hypothetical protein